MLRTRKTSTTPKTEDDQSRNNNKPHKDYNRKASLINASKFILITVAALGLVLIILSSLQSHSTSSYSFLRSAVSSRDKRWMQEKLHVAPLLFYSAWKIRQTGYVTRIASGCTDEQAEKEIAWHNKHVRYIFSDRFRIHMTPHFSSVSKDGNTVGEYKYFNKPFGLRHWMEHDELIDIHRKEQDTFVFLIDPDMILMRPITYDFSDDTETVVGKRASVDRKFKVSLGQPFAQTYGFGAHWLEKLDLIKIAGPDTPMKSLTKSVASINYQVGPPYLATVRDMYDIAVKWTEFAPKVHEQYPHLLAEMFAYCAASAHLQLPHQTIDSLMISNIEIYVFSEGWDLVDKIPDEKVCFVAENPTSFALHPVPNVVHYCQDYSSGGVKFEKREMAENFFTCDSQLLKKPNITMTKDQMAIGDKSVLWKREGFMVCSIVGTLNGAGAFFKDHHCD